MSRQKSCEAWGLGGSPEGDRRGLSLADARRHDHRNARVLARVEERPLDEGEPQPVIGARARVVC